MLITVKQPRSTVLSKSASAPGINTRPSHQHFCRDWFPPTASLRIARARLLLQVARTSQGECGWRAQGKARQREDLCSMLLALSFRVCSEAVPLGVQEAKRWIQGVTEGHIHCKTQEALK